MTLEEVQKLSDEELQIKVAEFCNFKNIRMESVPDEYDSERSVLRLYGELADTPNPSMTWVAGACAIPDYCNDLNAMHEIEKDFEDVKLTICAVEYADHLMKIIKIPRDCIDSFRLLRATARERAEAFVLTLSEK